MKTSPKLSSNKYFFTSAYIILVLFISLGINYQTFGQAQTITSTNQSITIGVGQTLYYCVNDPIDELVGNNPNTQSFSGDGITNWAPGRARFSPTVAGAGTHTILYHGRAFRFVVSNPVTPTLDPFGTYCSNSPEFVLSGGLPLDPTGKYYVEGVVATTFDPGARGAGTFSVLYSVGTGNCLEYSNIQTIVVKGNPVTFAQPATPVCSDAPAIDLSFFVSPSGGTFSGTGVSGSTFDPSAVTAPGTYTIRYTYSDATCTFFAERSITVNPLPLISITGLVLNHCDSYPDINFTYSPVSGPGGSGILTGDGITDIGGGNATFSPSAAGLGYHTMRYTYTDINGCSNYKEMLLRVGTDITLTGLATNYCANEPPVTFNYSHFGPVYPHTLTITGGSGLTDNNDGTAIFDPSAGVGTYTITYTYTDDLTCINRIEHFVQVLPVPAAQFSGLNAAGLYCEGAADVTLTGNPPGGTFSGPAGSVTDHGGGTATFRPSALIPGGPYPITYSFTNSSGCSDSKVKNVIINPLPLDYLVAGTGSYCQGSGGLTVTLFDSDPGVNYQLYKNGVADGAPIPGTGNSITWTGKNAGNYTVTAITAATGCSRLMSGSAFVTELAQSAITKMPESVSVCETGTAVFTITASGQNLSYAWTKNSVPAGGNSNILTIPNVGTSDNGHSVVCTVTSSCGAPLVSIPALLTVLPATSITAQPVSTVKCTGGSVSFTVTAAGSALAYQWKKDGVDIADIAGKISGSNTSSLSISNLAAADKGSYTCHVTGTCGSATSNPADLQVDDPVVITLQPVNKNVCLGDNTSFIVNATGTNLTYQWYLNNNPVPGATSSVYPVSGAALSDAGTYYCTVTSPCGQTVNSNTVSLSILNATTISSNPSGSTVCQGASINFTVIASGSNLTYQWIKDGTPLSDNARITGTKLSTIAITGLTLADAGNYVCFVSGDCGSVTTPAAALNVEQAVTFNSQPVNRTVCPGSDATFSVSVDGTNLTFEWQKNNFPVPGATNPDFTVVAATSTDAGNYRCRITNACGSVFSNEVSLTVDPVTAITTQPSGVTSCVNLNVSFSVAASGSNLTYQWYKNAGIIAGAQNPALNLTNITPSDAGAYTCAVTGTCGSVTSSPAILDVDIAPVIASQPLSKTVCPGMPAELSVVVPVGTNLTYQWVKDGVATGSDSPVYNIPSFAAGDAGSYHCNITNSCGTVMSNTAVLSVGSPVNITSNPSSVNACMGNIASFSVTATGSDLTYQWQKDGFPLPNGGTVSGVNTSTLTINGIAAGDYGNYRCIVTNSCNSQASASALLTVSMPATITLQPQSQTGCTGEALNIIIIATGTNLTYQWYKDGAPVGTDNPAFNIPAFAASDAGVYRCEITNGCGTVVSDNAVISPGIETNITTHPVSADRCTGNDVSFFVTANGSDLTWQWKKDGVIISDDTRITGSNTNSLSISGILISDYGTYTCNAIGNCGTITSNGAVLTVYNPVSITSQPANLTACNGDNAVFSVAATGDNLTYSWQKNGSPILPAQTSSSLVLTGIDNSHEGIYNCIVSNSCSFEISTSAELVVEDNLIINTHPSSVTQCEGTNVSFSVVASGPSNISYKWYKEGAMISDDARITGSGSSVLNINSIIPADAGSYSCRLTSSCGFDETDIAVLTVQRNVSITVSPVSFSVLTGSTANFTVVASGDITGYQWRKDGVDLIDGGNISGALTPNLTIANTTSADEGAYTCFVTGICNSLPCNNANLTVLTSSSITVQPVPSVTVCEGGSLNLFIAVSGAGHTFQWKKDGINVVNGANISGATTPTLTISGLSAANQGAYTCLVDAVESSSPSTVIINPSTVITQQPLDAVKCVNDNVTFMVTANGSGLTYQWQKDLVPVPGANNNTLIINSLVDGDDGVYNCIVTGDCGGITSNPATLVVNKNTVITSHPAGSVLCEGNSITMNIVAGGDNLSYQWKKNGSVLTDAANISGTTTGSLVISNALPADGGIYNCTVTGACGTETSNFATLVVNSTTTIIVQPIGRTKCAGDNVVFAVNAAGQNLVYQWQRNGSNVTDDGNITGASTSTLSIASLSLIDHQGTYTCLVTGICGAATSDPAVLTVSDVTAITVQPAPSVPICQGNSVTISITASGGDLSYQWYKNGSVINNGGNISGVNTDKLVISNALVSDAGFYTCTVTGTCGSVTSNLSALQVNPTTVITMHPVGQALCEGDNVQFMVGASGAGPLTYQWKKDNVPLPAANGSTLTLNGITISDAGAYSCSVTGLCGSAESNPATLLVNPQISISVQPVNVSVCENNAAIFSLNATGTNIIYKWKYNNAYITDGGRITGSATNELRIAFATNTDEGIYKCEITSTCGSMESNSAVLTVDELTTIVTHPVNQTIVQGSTTSFSISAAGIITGYQWRKDGIDLSDGPNISGSNSAALNLTNVAAADAGSYQCLVTGKCGPAISNTGILTVIVPVTIVNQPASQTKCTGESASFSVTATGTIFSYQWKRNGINLSDGAKISGSQTPDLVIASLDITDAGIYTCVVTGSFNTANSTGAVLTINEAGVITGQPGNKNICEGDWLVLEVTATGSGITYLWEKNNAPITPGPSITGINTPLLVITDVTSADAGSYRCVISNPCKTEISNPAIVTINPDVSFSAHPVSDSKCELQTTSFSVTANGVNILYQWFRNGVPLSNTARISGVATSNLIINNLTVADQGNYYCMISDNCSSAYSNIAVLEIKALTVINSQPEDKSVCEGEDSFFEVTATGDNLFYQWQKNGTNLSDGGNIFGSGSSVLIIQNTTIADQGVYRCQVTGSCNSMLSSPASLNINPLPGPAGVVTGENIVCQGARNVLYVVPAIVNATSYAWELPYGANIVSGAGTRSILVDFSTISMTGVVSVAGINACGRGPDSPLLPVTVNTIPVADAGPDQTLCSDNTTLNGNVTAFGTWTKTSGLASIVSPNLPNSAVTNLGQGDNVFVWTVSENGCVATDQVVITNKQLFADAGADQTICSLSAILNANIPGSGLGSWSVISGGGLISNINDPKANINNLIRGTTILRWSINNGGCVSYDEVAIINDLPSNADAGADTIILVDNYTLDGNNPQIGTGFWTLLSGSGTITNPSQYNTTVTNLGIEENIFQWTITKNLCYTHDEVKVINYTPTLTDAGPNQTLCVDHTILNGTKPNYGTGQWSVIAGSGTFKDPSEFDTEVINIGKGQNIYRWTVYEYEITFDDVVITNNSPSSANAGIDQSLCIQAATLAGNNPLIGTGIWTITGGSGNITNPSAYNSTVSNLGYGSNTFRWTINYNGCSSYDELVIVNNQPTAADAGVDQITCADSINLYPNTPTIGTGEWSVVQGSAFFVGNKAYNLAINNNLLKYTISNNGCFDSDTVLIVSNKPTTSFTGADKSICVDSITLPGNTPLHGTGVWTMLNGSAVFEDINDPQSKVTNLASGQNRFRWTITYNGCSSYSEVDIFYNYIQSDAGADQVLCQANAILSANDPGVGTGQWSVVGGSGSANFLNPNQATTEVTGLDKGINILRWTITNGTCISFDEVAITNNTPSTAYAGSDRSVCGEQIFLNANRPSIGTGEWIVLSGSANIADPTLYNSGVTNLSIGQNVLRWTITNQNCTSSDEVVIKNDQPSNIEAGPDQYNCSSSAQLYATAPVGGYGRWSISDGSATFQDNTLFNTTVSNLERGENTLVWTVTVAGCSNSDTIIIANNLPSTPNAGPDQDICADNAFMSANQPLIGTGRWSIVSGSAVFDDRALPGAKASNLGNGPNTLRWTITNGSCVLYDEVIIQNSLPTVAYAGEDRAVCNTTANLLAEAPVSGTGSWSVVSGYGVFADPRRFDTQITALGFGQNTLRWTTENGRCRTSDDVIITNNLAEAYAGLDQVVYASDVRLVGNNPASGTGQWIILAGRGTIENPSNFETNVSALGGGANTFSWTINNDGCIASDDVVITNKILPVTDFDPLPGKGCAPLTVSFVNNSIGGAPFRWDFGDGTSSAATNTNHTYTVPGNYRVRLTATGPDGITLHKDTIVVVYEIPVAQFKISSDTAYVPGNSVNFFNLTENIDSLRWDFGDGNISKETNPSYKYAEPGSYDVSLHVWSGFQCYDSVLLYDAVTVERAGIVRCPNSFTPNLNGPTGGYFNQNDFSNDVFHCFMEGVNEYHLEIYNRLGIIIFRSDDINIGWDGYFKGKLVEEGAYVFKTYGRYNNGERFDFIGNIVLLH